MEEVSNATYSNISTLDEQDKALYFGGVTALIVLLVPAQLILNTAVLVGLCASESFKRIPTQRNYMAGLLATSYISCAGMLFYAVAEYLFLSDLSTAAQVFCHLASWLAQMDLAVRDVLLAFFCVTIFIIVKWGSKKINGFCSCLAFFMVCIVPMVFTVVLLVPQAVDFSSGANGVVCMPTIHPAGAVGLAVTVVGFRLPAHLLTIVIACGSFALIRQHTLAGRRDIEIAAAKISLIIACLNTLFIVHAVGLVLLFAGQWSRTGFAVLAHVLYYVVPSLSSFAYPLLVVGVFKPLRQQLTPRWCRLQARRSRQDKEQSSTHHSYSNSLHYHECATVL